MPGDWVRRIRLPLLRSLQPRWSLRTYESGSDTERRTNQDGRWTGASRAGRSAATLMYGDLNSAPDDQEQLADLRWHWDLAYEINLCGGTWTARFLTAADMFSAASADDLRRRIRADYKSRTAAPTSGNAASAAGVEAGIGVQALRRLRDEGVI
jgi:hypothetical protein